MDFANLRLVQLNSKCIIDFRCGDADLDGFFRDDWFPHFTELLAVTYCMYSADTAVAMVSLHNDKIEAKRMLGASRRGIPNPKRRGTYPAVMIGRFAVAKEFQRQGIGENLMEFLKAFFIIRNKTGCRYITLDAYPIAYNFYVECGFKPMKPFEVWWKKYYWKFNSAGRRLGLLKSTPGNILMYLDLYKMAGVLKGDPELKAKYHAKIQEMLS